MMRAYDRIRDMAEDELSKIAEHGELSPAMLPDVHLLTDIIKNVDKICILNEEGGGYSRDGGNSNRGYSRDGGTSNRGYSREGGNSNRGSYGGYDEESSYRRRRDSMGRYSREGGKEHMMHQLGEMMRNADEHEREALEKCMRELDKNN
jgi:hypothetical protein